MYVTNLCARLSTDCPKAPWVDRPSALQFIHGQGCRYALGDAERAPSVSLIDASDPTKGLVMAWGGGDPCEGTVDHDARLFNLRVVCEPDMEPADSPVLDHVAESPICSYTMTMRTRAGCPTSVPGLSGGTIFLIVLSSLVAAYLVGGVTYNVRFGEKQGLDAVPNAGFWRDLPGLVADGAGFLGGHLRALLQRPASAGGPPGAQGYERVSTRGDV